MEHHASLHDTVKGKLTSSYSKVACSELSKSFYRTILDVTQSCGNKEMDLMVFVQKSMFPAVVGDLFGKDNLSMSDVRCIN